MKNLTTHGFAILVVSMVIVVTFQAMNFVDTLRYQRDTADAQKAAMIDRQSLKNLVSNNDLYDKQLGYYLTRLINNNTNQTNTLVKFLVDNFGENSGYIERENFQYKQANDTYVILKEIRNLLGNQT